MTALPEWEDGCRAWTHMLQNINIVYDHSSHYDRRNIIPLSSEAAVGYAAAVTPPLGAQNTYKGICCMGEKTPIQSSGIANVPRRARQPSPLFSGPIVSHLLHLFGPELVQLRLHVLHKRIGAENARQGGGGGGGGGGGIGRVEPVV